MSIDRRELLKAGFALPAVAALSSAARADVAFDPQPGAWRSFQIVTRLDIADTGDRRQAWIPVPAVNERDWFKSLGSDSTSNGRVGLARDPKYGAEMFHVAWTDDEKNPFIEVTSKIATRDRATDFTKAGVPAPLSAADRALYTQGTELIPVDGIVKETSDKIVANANAATDIQKARALYEWIVDNTFRDAKVRGCGIGDIAAMLKTGNLGGKCADLNALYVGLTRAAGLPARDLYGIRVAPSKFGYKSLGASSEVITKAQHCRSEVYLAASAGCRSMPPTCAKSCWKSRRRIWPSTIPESSPRAKRCSAPGKAIGLRTILRTTSRSKDQWVRGSRFSCTRKPSAAMPGSIVSMPILSNTRLPQRS
jgi:transglutaminase-like putative cysteine protease